MHARERDLGTLRSCRGDLLSLRVSAERGHDGGGDGCRGGVVLWKLLHNDKTSAVKTRVPVGFYRVPVGFLLGSIRIFTGFQQVNDEHVYIYLFSIFYLP